MNNRYDAVIIGAVALIEKNDRVGKKLLATGNGRCNLTNCHITPEHYFGSFQRQAGNIFAKYDAIWIGCLFLCRISAFDAKETDAMVTSFFAQ